MSTPEPDVVGRFLKEGRLVVMPTKRAKLLLVLDRIVQEFELGVTYPEAHVNEVLATYHGDYPALRRYLVDEGFLTRDGGVYWRSGGTVEI